MNTDPLRALIGMAFSLICALTGAAILEWALPEDVVKNLPRWLTFGLSFVVGYCLWIWTIGLYSVAFDRAFDAVFGKSDQDYVDEPAEQPAEKVSPDIEKIYAALPTARLEELLKAEGELIPGAGEFLRRELVRRSVDTPTSE
jgi:hypothetical protein